MSKLSPRVAMRDYAVDTIIEQTIINAPIDRVFALSTRIELVQQTLGMKLIDSGATGCVTTGHITANSRVHWRGWKFSLPTNHHTLITAFDPPHNNTAYFEDSQERGRFATFRHEHFFNQLGEQTTLEDRIHFALPFGPLGRLAAKSLLALHLRKLARQRFATIKQLAEGEGWRQWLTPPQPNPQSPIPALLHLTTRGAHMKAAVLHEYGPPSNLKYEDFDNPKPGEGEVLVRVSAASINPVDYKMRSGAAKDRFPVEFPAILGRDVSGIVREVGAGVTTFAPGDRVMAVAPHTYAELCIVKASELALIPEGLEITTAAATPLVSVTGNQLVRDGAKCQPGQTILISGGLGSVGRCAVYAAKEIGAKIIAGVRSKQLEEVKALPGVVEAIALDNEEAIARLGLLDCVADTVGGDTAPKLLAKVKQGGNFGSVVGSPKDAALHPTIQINAIMAHPDPASYVHYGEAIRDGKLALPIDRMLPLADAAEAHAIAEKHVPGKIILTV